MFLSVQNLDDERNVELQKRNLSLPTIDLEPEIERTKFKSTGVNQLGYVKKGRRSGKFSLFKRTVKDEDALRGQSEKSMHLDWSSKMKLWHNLKEQLPAKNHQNYQLLGRKFKSKSGELICDPQLFEPNRGRRNSWWFGLDTSRKNSAIEIVSLKQHSIQGSDQVQHFVNSECLNGELRKNSAQSIRSDKLEDDSRYGSCRFVDSGGESSASKSDLNDKSDSKADLTGDLNNNSRLRNSSGENCGSDQSERAVYCIGGCFQGDDDQETESGLKVSLYFRFVCLRFDCATHNRLCK